MRNRIYLAGALCWAVALTFAQAPKKEMKMEQYHATGAFDVKAIPQPGDDPALGRLKLDKQFHGELEAGSIGEMLTASTAVEGSAGYVAIERVTGSLKGRKGSFVLQHVGTMGGGKFQLAVTVLPDSGTGELEGITGAMKIRIEAGGKHFYDFDYQLAAR